MPFTQELVFGPYASGIWTESPQIEYRTLLLYDDPIMPLFAAGEQGFWYDPSDFSTLFQDSVGATPVTAAGQSVGLVLDKSRGLVPGPELVTNGGFDVDANWTKGGTVAIASGVATLGASSTIKQALAWSTATKGYLVEFTLSSYSGSVSLRSEGGGAGVAIHYYAASTGTHRVFVRRPGVSDTTLTFATDVGAAAVFDNISVKELPGNHATQSNASQRPILRQNGSLYYLEFDGTDDGMVTGTITPGTDKAQVFAGVRANAALGMILETSADATANAGALYLYNNEPSARYDFLARGSLSGGNSISNRTAPETAVITGQAEVATDTNTIRRNGVAGTPSTTDQGTGNFLAYPLYIGRRGGTSLPFNGHIYSLIGRFGANLTTAQIEATERWVASKTGVTL